MAQTTLPARALAARAQPSARRLLARRLLLRAEPYLYLLPALLSIIIWVYRPLLGTLELSAYQPPDQPPWAHRGHRIGTSGPHAH
jgi:hypothetical protein